MAESTWTGVCLFLQVWLSGFVGKRGIFTNEILAQKMRTVKSTLDGREFS